MMAQKENAPKVGSQAGAAEMQLDCSTLAEDLRFAFAAMGAGELLQGGGVREIPSVLGASALCLAALLALGIVL